MSVYVCYSFTKLVVFFLSEKSTVLKALIVLLLCMYVTETVFCIQTLFDHNQRFSPTINQLLVSHTLAPYQPHT